MTDVEQIFSNNVLKFMERKNYEVEASYIRVINNWQRACDERGLSDSERSRFNHNFIDYILDELMPWHRQPGLRDFSTLEVNQ